MRPIGIDYTAAYEQGAGIGRLVRQLMAALAEADSARPYKLFVAGARPDKLPPPPGPNFSWYPTRLTPLWFARLWYRARLYWPVESFIGPVALYHATDFTLPPTLPSTKTILTVHDLSYVRAPETAPPVLKRYLDRVVPWSVQRATHVIADSQATKDDLIALYSTPPDKISVLLSGVEDRFQPAEEGQIKAVRAKYALPEGPYIFSVGTVQPRKNYARLMQALHSLGPDFAGIHLVIAGGKGWLEDPIYETMQALGLGERVKFTGFVADEDLPALYSGAILTAYPSLYEGFGFPIVESMACGTPVISSRVSSMPEVAGEAALLVNPYEVGDIAAALHHLLSDPAARADLTARGRQQVAKFTWQKAAFELQSLYQQILDS
jgi:glycosyltransferase involved in cell wall biosynthesis